jgi:glycosyltransferase involved in cell wall biosynthesis
MVGAGDDGGAGPVKPRVSVVVTAYNQADVIRAAAVSAVEQRRVVTEVVVVDDGSADDPAAAVEDLPRTRVLRQANGGVNSARNTGLRAALGEFIVFLDGDDTLLPDAAAIGVASFEADPRLGFAIGRALHVDRDGVVVGRAPEGPKTGDLYRALLRRPWVYPPSSVMFRAATLRSLGGFDETLPQGGEDLELYLRAARSMPGRDHAALVVRCNIEGGFTADRPAVMLPRNLAIMDREAAFVGGDPDLERALAAGRRYVRWLWRVKQAQVGLRQASDRRSRARGAAALLWAFVRDPDLSALAVRDRFQTRAWRSGRSTADGSPA